MAQRQTNARKHDRSITDSELRIRAINCESHHQTPRIVRANARFAPTFLGQEFRGAARRFTRRGTRGSVHTAMACRVHCSDGVSVCPGTAHHKTFSTYVPLNAVAS